MIYDLTEDQARFRDAVESYLTKNYSEETRRKIVASEAGMSVDLWRGLASDIGVLGLAFDEADGGLGGGALDQIPVMEAFGRALLVEPYLETAILAGELLKRSTSPVARPLIEGIINGEIRLAVARTEPGHRFASDPIDTLAKPISAKGYRITGQKTTVVAAPWAHSILVVAKLTESPSDRVSVFVVPADAQGVRLHNYRTIDGRRASDIDLEAVVVTAQSCLMQGPDAVAALSAAYDVATAAVCAEAVGIMRCLLGQTHAHLQDRRQFGAPLASFQVLQHRMADMLVALELSAAHAYRAASALDSKADNRESAVSAAKAFIGRAAKRVAHEAVQMHGGMGMSDELMIGRLFKRTIAIEAQFGSTSHHIRRFQMLRDAVAA
ncbi:MAG TPA: acyl-CoA dehydrogenase [Caulobacteraceae bacterium]|nr:acyl-CoA dehydrogenase [Caulobacteraceae bacterium]